MSRISTSIRPLQVFGLGLLVVLVWTVAVFNYGFYDWAVFRQGVWLPPLNFKYQLEQLFQAWREHLVIIIGFLGFALTPVCRRMLRGQTDSQPRVKNTVLQGIFLIVLYSIFAWDQFELDKKWLLETKGQSLMTERSNYGFLFIALSGILGGWRIGMLAGLVNMLVLGWQGHFLLVAPTYPNQLVLRTVLTQLWGVVGIVFGVCLGYWREIHQLEFKPWHLMILGTLFEVLATLSTLVTTWAAPYHFDRFTHNILATGPLLALLFWWLQRQAQTDPKALHLTQSELALVQAELRAFRAQMNPHFLINSLSVIHHLVRSEPDKARELLLDLSDVLQHTIRSGNFVTLTQEIEQTKAYLALEQARYTNRLEVKWEISSQTNLQRFIPTLTLQPLVENAVRHGIAPRAEGGLVRIEINEHPTELIIRVMDNGVGFKTQPVPKTQDVNQNSGHRIALHNISERLRLIYGQQNGVQIQSKLDHGTTITIRFPNQNNLAIAANGTPTLTLKANGEQ